MKIHLTHIATAIAICALVLVTEADAAGFTRGRETAPLSPEFKPGDYVWKPEASPAGPVVIIASIPEQTMYVYRNGVRIGRSTVSTGAKGHKTPTGVFTILQKKVDHESSIYKGAKMPHMQRLTWSGIAMHAGRLPGYPASHGCVRLPVDFAEKLYTVTSNGTTVIVTDRKNAPGQTGPRSAAQRQDRRRTVRAATGGRLRLGAGEIAEGRRLDHLQRAGLDRLRLS